MKKYFLPIFIGVLLVGETGLCAEAPDTAWTKTFGGTDRESGYCIQETSDSGYIIVGYTESFGAGSYDVWLIKTDKYGDTLWTKTYGNTDFESGEFVQQTQDGGFIITGEKIGLKTNVYLIRTDSLGDTLWTRTYGGDVGKCVQQTNDGGFIIVDRSMRLIKTDSLGDSLWARTYGGIGNKVGSSVQQTFDGGFILTGFTSEGAQGYYDIWLIKTNANGDSLWANIYGGTGWDSVQFGCQTSDSGFIIVGYTDSYGAGEGDVWLVKADRDGTKLWDKTFGGTSMDKGSFVQETSDGGFIITGYTESYGVGGLDMWVIRTDKNGKKLWDKTFGGTAMSCEYGNCVRQTSDGGYIILGGNNDPDIWLIKLEPDAGTEEGNLNLPNEFLLSQNSSNPFSNSTEIKFGLPEDSDVNISIYNLLGEKVATLIDEPRNAGCYTTRWDATDNSGEKLATGVYFAKLSAKSQGKTYTKTLKICLMR